MAPLLEISFIDLSITLDSACRVPSGFLSRSEDVDVEAVLASPPVVVVPALVEVALIKLLPPTPRADPPVDRARGGNKDSRQMAKWSAPMGAPMQSRTKGTSWRTQLSRARRMFFVSDTFHIFSSVAPLYESAQLVPLPFICHAKSQIQSLPCGTACMTNFESQNSTTSTVGT